MRPPLVSVSPRILASALVIAAVWGLLGAAWAQPRPDVTLWVPADSVTTGESFALTIESSTPAHRGIAFPPATADSVFGGLEVLTRSDVHTRRVGGGYAIDSVSYTVRTSARDSLLIPAVPIRVDAATGTLTTFTEPRALRIQARSGSVLPSSLNTDTLTPIAWLVLALAGGGVLYGTVRLWSGLLNRKEPQSEEVSGQKQSPAATETEATPSPYETAVQQLDDLSSQELTDPSTVEAVHVTLAHVLRTYLSRRLGLTTEERTTDDLLAALDRRSDAPPEAVAPLRTALVQADRVKFAAARPDPATTKAALRAARTALAHFEDSSSPNSDPPSE